MIFLWGPMFVHTYFYNKIMCIKHVVGSFFVAFYK